MGTTYIRLRSDNQNTVSLSTLLFLQEVPTSTNQTACDQGILHTYELRAENIITQMFAN